MTRPRMDVRTPIAILVLLVASLTLAADATQQHFKTPTAAMQSIIGAAHRNDGAALLTMLGPDGEPLVSSGDAVEDAAERRRFVAGAQGHLHFETLADGSMIAIIGRDQHPFAIPLVKDADGWRFDTKAGLDELLNRRIGRNELAAIAACRGYVEAQLEYARKGAGGKPGVFAQRVLSTEGTRDGLYWPPTGGREQSPLGPAFASATGAGYKLDAPADGPRPYHGYLFRILTQQGANASGGAHAYVKDGAMTDGFGLVAWPAEYRQSGVMTFVVNRQGIVFQKDLGEKTSEIASAMTSYDPDASWEPAR